MLRRHALDNRHRPQLAEAVYVLHAFQKKSKTGVKTPKVDINLIEKRLKDLIEERKRRL